MKKIITLSLIAISLISFSFIDKNNVKEKKASSGRTCEYSFYVKCDGSNQFVDVIRAKDQSTAKSMCKNKYSNCTVNAKDSNGKNCE
jgi:hypothetical protein